MIASNRASEVCTPSRKEADMLAMKIDLLLEKFEDYSQDKAQMQTLQALETNMMCEVCGNVGVAE